MRLSTLLFGAALAEAVTATSTRPKKHFTPGPDGRYTIQAPGIKAQVFDANFTRWKDKQADNTHSLSNMAQL